MEPRCTPVRAANRGRATLLLLFWTVTGAACVPVVTHGPRVEPGLTAGGVLSVGTQPILETEMDHGGGSVSPVLPPQAVFARFGWTPETAGTPVPVSAGVLLPLAGPFAPVHPEGDVYVQFVSGPTPGTAAGAGVLVSPSYAMPYVQIGRDVDDVLSLHTTQGFTRYRGRGLDASVWMPAVAARAGRFHLWVQGGLGRERLVEEDGTPDSRPVRFVMAGMVVEAPRIPRW